MFQRKDLDELLIGASPPAISLYMPASIAGREVRQNPIRLKNLVARAAEQLRADGRRSAADELFGPVATLVEDITQYQETHSAAPMARHAGAVAKAQPLGDAPADRLAKSPGLRPRIFLSIRWRSRVGA